MKRRRFLKASALATMGVLAACSAPAQPATAPAAAPAQNVAGAKPVFIDFYAPW